MKRILNIEIDCGEKTCASEPGKFCEYLSTKKFGSIYLCGIFIDPDNVEAYTVLEEDEHGWLQRCQKCLDSE
jgi:hypothetical protein